MTLEDRYVTPTPEGVSLDTVLAGLGSRFAAILLDSLLQAVFFLVVFFVVAVALRGGGETSTLVGDGLLSFVGLLDFFGYFIVCEMLWSGRSVGTRAAGGHGGGPGHVVHRPGPVDGAGGPHGAGGARSLRCGPAATRARPLGRERGERPGVDARPDVPGQSVGLHTRGPQPTGPAAGRPALAPRVGARHRPPPRTVSGSGAPGEVGPGVTPSSPAPAPASEMAGHPGHDPQDQHRGGGHPGHDTSHPAQAVALPAGVGATGDALGELAHPDHAHGPGTAPRLQPPTAADVDGRQAPGGGPSFTFLASALAGRRHPTSLPRRRPPPPPRRRGVRSTRP